LWNGIFWGNNFWGGLFWGPPTAVVPVGGGTSGGGGSYPPHPRKPPKKKGPIAPSFVAEGPRPIETIRNILFSQQDQRDEEDLMRLLGEVE